MKSRNSFLRILSIVCLFSLLLAFLPAPSQNAVAASIGIDSFADNYTFEHTGASGTTMSKSFSTSSAIGGVRNLKIQRTLGDGSGTPAGLSAKTLYSSGPTGTFSFSADSGHRGNLTIGYDGTTRADNSYLLNRTGISPAEDLTTDGADMLYFSVITDDVSLQFQIDVYSDTSSCSRQILKVPGGIQSDQVPVALFFPYSRFARQCTTAADFENVTAIEILITGSENADITFNNLSTGSSDYGDASGSLYFTANYYETISKILYVAGHIIVPDGPILGTHIDSESDGQPSADAKDDDLIGVTDDEDGLSSTNQMISGSATGGTANIVTSGTGDACLYGWIDWNQDGEFGNGVTLETEYADTTSLDRILDGELITSAGTHSFTFPVPIITDPSLQYFVRVRLYPADPGGTCSQYSDGINSEEQVPYQKYPNKYMVIGGEIEDYLWGSGSTAVTVENYHAGLAQPTGLTLQWTTVMETNTAGFNLYRAEQPGDSYIKINPTLILPQTPGEISGNTYTYTDTTALPGVEYTYKLEHVATDTSTSEYGVTTAAFYQAHIPLVKR